jgi:hypothetical protein
MACFFGNEPPEVKPPGDVASARWQDDKQHDDNHTNYRNRHEKRACTTEWFIGCTLSHRAILTGQPSPQLTGGSKRMVSPGVGTGPGVEAVGVDAGAPATVVTVLRF